MRETTAEIWIGPDQTSAWQGTQGGINPTHLMLLRENSQPAWLLLPGNFHDSRPPMIKPGKVWVPTPAHPLQDALLFFAVVGARVPEVRAVFNEFEKSRSKNRLNLGDSFPRGLPKQVYEATQRHLRGFHVIASIGKSSLALKDLKALDRHKGLNIEIRTSR